MSYFENIDIKAADSPSIDAFGRWRVSELTTLIDVKQIFDKQPLLVDEETIGSGSALHSTSLSQTALSVVGSGDAVVMQTFNRFNYQTGKSQLTIMTFNAFGNETNVTKRVGYFSSSTSTPFTGSLDGLFLESDGTNLSVNAFRTGTEVASVNRSSWDDPLDGTGASGVTHDFDNNTILAFDFEWLGFGRVRWFVVKNGTFIKFHEFDFTDTVNVYMSSPNQPLRWEVRGDGVGGGGFNYVCSTVNTEGSINKIGKVLSANSDNNDLQLTTAGTLYAAVGIRLKSTNLDAAVDLIEFDYLAETNDRALWELRLNPTVTGTFSYTGITNSSVEVSVGNQTAGTAPTVTGGTILASGYVEQNGGRRIQIDSAIKLGAAIDGTPDEIVLCVKPIDQGLDAYASFNWRELV
jgi:hypothetical protein